MAVGSGRTSRSPGRSTRVARHRRAARQPTVTDDTGGTGITCTVTYPGGGVFGNVTVQKDSSPPQIDGSLVPRPGRGRLVHEARLRRVQRGRRRVGLASCSGNGTYGGPDGGAITLTGTCSDNAGNSASKSLTIKYDSTPPTVTAVMSRRPDANGWYNRPVDVTFSGTDGGSGVRSARRKSRTAGRTGARRSSSASAATPPVSSVRRSPWSSGTTTRRRRGRP